MNEVATRSDEQAMERHLIEMDQVVTESLKGFKPAEIASVVGMSVGKVNRLLKEWRGLAQNNSEIRDRATMALRNADEHYDKLIKKAYEALEAAEFGDSNTQKMNAIKLIADLEKARLDSLHRAGLLEDNDITRQLIETERKQEVLMGILKNTVGPCDHCRPIVQEKLAQITNDVVVIPANV
jgi:hypothetical protein